MIRRRESTAVSQRTNARGDSQTITYLPSHSPIKSSFCNKKGSILPHRFVSGALRSRVAGVHSVSGRISTNHAS